MSNDRRRDGSKPTFAERDRQRRDDGDSRRQGPRGGGTARSRADKAYRDALEKAFESGQVLALAATMRRARDGVLDLELPRAGAATPEPEPSTPAAPPKTPQPAPPPDPVFLERRKLIGKIRSAEGARDIARAIDKYLARFDELPNDFEILERALGHLRVPVVRRALEQLAARVAKEKPRRSRSLAMQLAILEDTHDDDEVRALASSVRAALG